MSSKLSNFFIQKELSINLQPTFSMQKKSSCPRCDCEAFKKTISPHNWNENVDRSYYICIKCKTNRKCKMSKIEYEKDWISWDDNREMHSSNRSCDCKIMCRQDRARKYSSCPGRGFWTCAIGSCGYLSLSSTLSKICWIGNSWTKWKIMRLTEMEVRARIYFHIRSTTTRLPTFELNSRIFPLPEPTKPSLPKTAIHIPHQQTLTQAPKTVAPKPISQTPSTEVQYVWRAPLNQRALKEPTGVVGRRSSMDDMLWELSRQEAAKA